MPIARLPADDKATPPTCGGICIGVGVVQEVAVACQSTGEKPSRVPESDRPATTMTTSSGRRPQVRLHLGEPWP
eukprot:gene12904-biopygen1225